MLSFHHKWIQHAACTKELCGDHSDLGQGIEANVLVQIQNLKTHPSVAAGLANGSLNLFAWVYHFEKGMISVYHKNERKFLPATELPTESEFNPENFSL